MIFNDQEEDDSVKDYDEYYVGVDTIAVCLFLHWAVFGIFGELGM